MRKKNMQVYQDGCRGVHGTMRGRGAVGLEEVRFEIGEIVVGGIDSRFVGDSRFV